MTVELDHVIFCCDVGAPEGDALVAAGLLEGSSNTHPGQGTANRRFFLANAYIELLWVDDLAQARCEPAFRTRLWERWLRRRDGACPFGIVLRPAIPDADIAPPFPTWAYHAPYLPPRVSIGIAVATPLTEPEFLHVAFATRPDAKNIEPLKHPSGVRTVTGVRIGTPGPQPQSPAAKAMRAEGLVSFYVAPEFVMELTFDGRANARYDDLRPLLPLVMCS